MVQRLTCPGCGRSVSIRDDASAATVSCPRCLTPLSGPALTAVQEAGSAVTEPPARPAGMESVWRDLPPVRPAGLDRDIKRDTTGTSVVLAILVGCCILGIVAVFLTWGGPHKADSGYNILSIVVLFGILDFLVIVQVGLWLNPWRSGAWREAGASLGKKAVTIVVFALVFTVLAIAVVVFFLGVCWSALGP